MGGKTQSKRQATEDSRSAAVESLSETAIKRALRSDALQHPATILPLALCGVFLTFLFLYQLLGLVLGLILIGCSAAVAAASFFWHYSVRYSEAYTRRVQEVMALQEQEERGAEQVELEELREAIQSGLESINSAEGLKAVRELVYEYEELQHVLEREKETDPLSVAHLPTLAEATYRQGLSVLEDVLELARVIHSSSQARLGAEIAELEREIESLKGDRTQAAQVEIKEATVASHKERLEMIRQQQLREDKLLYQCDRCEASLHRTRIELAALKVEGSETSVSAVTETLEKTITQAKEVQEELRRLGY